MLYEINKVKFRKWVGLSLIVSCCIRAEPLVRGYAAIKPLYIYAGLV